MDGTISEVRVIFLPIWIIDGWVVRHLHSIRCGTAGNIVENAIYFEVICPEGCCCHEGEE
jgi:hypothetical protein